MEQYKSCEVCGRFISDVHKCKDKPSDDCLLEVYYQGFNDELDNKVKFAYNNELIIKAYKLGRSHALIGDDIRLVDYLTEEEIIERILNKSNE